MLLDMRRLYILTCVCFLAVCHVLADEHVILVGPKTIGPGWKDNIVLESRLFATAKAGDIVTVYTDRSKRTACRAR